MKKIAILLTCFNRKGKTMTCLTSLEKTYKDTNTDLDVVVYLTDDGCTDGTVEEIQKNQFSFPIFILEGTGKLYWNGGMIMSWKAAIKDGGFEGYLWLNDDTIVLPEFWNDLQRCNYYCHKTFGKGGIYVGSTKDIETGEFTYGGFNYVNKWTLQDEFVHPDGMTFQECQCAHGNITFVSQEVVDSMGIFYDGYIHGAGDHDYTYRAYKAGFPVLVMPHYAGICENDHVGKKAAGKSLEDMTLSERIKYLKSPFGFNLHNSLLFQKRCFPHRYLLTWIAGYARIFLPKIYRKVYLGLRK